MRVLVTGGTGLVGSRLVRRLAAEGHGVTVVSREPGRVPFQAVGWDGLDDVIAEIDAVVNLAGEPIAAGRWTAARKREIRASRIDATRVVVRAMREREPRPRVLVNASATGYYGDRGDDELDETAPAGTDRFTASLCKAWEVEAMGAEALGVRVVRLRTGIV
ncbi:MAG TPA: NAD-dependent epimerase/dehydratase family protein, partial [Actinomycetota bacterium]